MDLNSLVQTSITGTTNSLLPFAPELILCVSIMGLLLIRMLPFGEKIDAGFLAFIASGAALYFAGPWNSYIDAPEKGIYLFDGMIVFDSFTIAVRAVLLVFTLLFVVFTKFSGMPAKEDGTDFYCMIMGAILGMCLMVSANHLLMVFLAVEMASVPSYALAGILRGHRPSSEAALKYSIYGAGAAGVMLYGISLLAGLVNSAHLPTIAQNLAANVGDMSRPEQMVLVLAGLMIMVGLAFKLSAVPFHFWCPDIFEGAAAEIGAFLSIASKAAALALLVRVVFGVGMTAPDRISAAEMTPPSTAVAQETLPESTGMFAVADEVAVGEHSNGDHSNGAADPLEPIRKFMGVMIAVIAAITCTFGNLAAYGQTNIKRLFAYSTIAHAGYMMMPVPAALALASEYPDSATKAIAAIVLYIVIYMFMNLGAFAIVAFLRNSMGTEEIEDFGGMISKSPALVVCFVLILISLVGLPPLAGFIGKFALFAGVADGYFLTKQTHLVVLLAIGGINTAISLFYYLRVVKVMTIDPESDALSTHEGPAIGLVPLSFVVLLTVPVALLILNWNQLTAWSFAAAQQLFG